MSRHEFESLQCEIQAVRDELNEERRLHNAPAKLGRLEELKLRACSRANAQLHEEIAKLKAALGDWTRRARCAEQEQVRVHEENDRLRIAADAEHRRRKLAEKLTKKGFAKLMSEPPYGELERAYDEITRLRAGWRRSEARVVEAREALREVLDRLVAGSRR